MAPTARHRGRTTIVISSDEENEDLYVFAFLSVACDSQFLVMLLNRPSSQSRSSAQLPPVARNNFVMDTLKQALPVPPLERKQVPAPVHIPSNRDILPGPSNFNSAVDASHQAYVYEPRMSATETEKALRALVEDSITPDDEIEIDMEEAIVEGFQDGITLLPHQVLGRAWMRDKETGKKRGGILADDMG